MKSALLFARYVVFGLFVACNAIICSVAVWNHSLVQPGDGPTLQVDIYLIFLGALCLAFILPIIFVDLLCSDPFSARVWFECVWVALIWLMQLAGAAAVTAIAPHTQCTSQASMFNNCVSTRVLLAFTWICTIILLLYLFLLVVAAVTSEQTDPGVWHHNVRYLRIEATRQCLHSAQNSPTTPRFNQGRGAVEVHNPRALRPVLPIYERHTGLSSEFEIEPYRPYAAGRMSVDSFSSLPEAVPPPPVSYPIPAFIYSQNSSQTRSPASRLHSSIVYTNPSRPSIPAQQAQASPVSPSQQAQASPASPVSSHFNWPRVDVMQQPVRTRRKPLPSAFELPRRSAQGPSEFPSNSPTDPLSHPRTRRPSGPRMRLSSVDDTQRPAPHVTRPNS